MVRVPPQIELVPREHLLILRAVREHLLIVRQNHVENAAKFEFIQLQRQVLPAEEAVLARVLVEPRVRAGVRRHDLLLLLLRVLIEDLEVRAEHGLQQNKPELQGEDVLLRLLLVGADPLLVDLLLRAGLQLLQLRDVGLRGPDLLLLQPEDVLLLVQAVVALVYFLLDLRECRGLLVEAVGRAGLPARVYEGREADVALLVDEDFLDADVGHLEVGFANRDEEVEDLFPDVGDGGLVEHVDVLDEGLERDAADVLEQDGRAAWGLKGMAYLRGSSRKCPGFSRAGCSWFGSLSRR